MTTIESPEDVRRWFLRQVSELWPLAAGSLSLPHRAVHSRALFGVRARSGPRQLCVVWAQSKPTVLCLRSRGIGSVGPASCGQRPQTSEAHARSGATVYGSSKGATGWRDYGEEEESKMITVCYRQRTLYEPLAVNLMADYKELLWEGWLLKVDKLLEDEDLVNLVRGLWRSAIDTVARGGGWARRSKWCCG